MRRRALIPTLVVVAIIVVIIVFGSGLHFANGQVGSSVTTTIYAHENSSPLNGGLVGNSTQFWNAKGTQTAVDSSATSSSQMIWSIDTYPPLANQITIDGNIVFTVYISSNASLSGVTLGAQVNEISNGGTGTETGLFNGEQTATISTSSTETAYTVTVPVGAATTIPKDYVLHLIVYVNPNTSHAYTFTIYFDSSKRPTHMNIPNTTPVFLYSPALAPKQVDSSGQIFLSSNVTDAWGEYDILNATAYAYYYSDSQQFLWSDPSLGSPAGMSPAAYSATWSGVLNSVASGNYEIKIAAFDNSGNAYYASPLGASVSVNDYVSYFVWAALLAAAIAFTTLSFVFAAGVSEAPSSNRERAISNPTNPTIGRGFSSLVKMPLIVRMLAFPFIASYFWAVLSTITSAMSFAASVGIAHLFLGIALIIVAVAIVFSIWTVWAIFWDNPNLAPAKERKRQVSASPLEQEG
jgi:hypothetical protein